MACTYWPDCSLLFYSIYPTTATVCLLPSLALVGCYAYGTCQSILYICAPFLSPNSRVPALLVNAVRTWNEGVSLATHTA